MAEGRIWYSLRMELETGALSLEIIHQLSRVMGRRLPSRWALLINIVVILYGCVMEYLKQNNPSVYRYLAMKINVASPLSAGSNANGCIKLELWDDSGDKGTIGNNYTGAVNSANNSFEVLNGGSFQTTAPNVIYWDLQSNYDKHTPTDWNQTFTLNCLKFVIADYTATDSYDIYWVRSFKTVEELEAFVASEDTNK